jgi:hypothetical protein
VDPLCEVNWGIGNINANPMFADAANGDYHLLAESPCIDAGDNTALPPDTLDLDDDGDTEEPIPFDLDGSPRISGLAVDMGAYEAINTPEEVLEHVGETIANLDPEGLNNPNSSNALANKINATLAMIEEGLYEEALDKLQDDILQKTDGCANEGAPDKNDWILTCEDQEKVYPLIVSAIELLESLL